VRNFLFKRLAVVMLVISLPALALGEGHEAEAHGFSHLIPMWINFVVYVALLFWLTKKPLLRFWASRREHIETAVQGGRSELEAAEARVSVIQRRISGIEQEISQLKQEVSQDTARECEQLKEAAKEKALKIAARSKESAKAEQKTAEAKVQREITELAFRLARQKLAGSTTLESDKGWRESTLGLVKNLAS